MTREMIEEMTPEKRFLETADDEDDMTERKLAELASKLRASFVANGLDEKLAEETAILLKEQVKKLAERTATLWEEQAEKKAAL